VFTRTGGVWSQQGPKLTGGGETGGGKFGTIVALSADGDTALIGGWNDDSSKGAAWVFTRSGSTWAQQGGKLIGAGETGAGRFGVSVALSADGDTALIGGLDDNGTMGAAWVFMRSASTWTQQGGKLTAEDEAGEGEFGTNVALSADGATALIGGWRDNGGVGAAWAFVDPPTATTGAATDVGEAGANLNGAIDAGRAGTAHFDYGTSVQYGASTAVQDVGALGTSRPLTATIGGLAPGTTYHFRLVTENSGGVSYGDDRTFVTEARAEPPPPPPPPVAPVVAQARQSRLKWREGGRLAGISRARAPIGTTFSFSLNEEATVAFSFAKHIGRKGRRTATAGTLTFPGHSGTNQVTFQGRISAAKKLEPGRYTLEITATSPAGLHSTPKSLSFTIVKG
jgi:hypothetical protein